MFCFQIVDKVENEMSRFSFTTRRNKKRTAKNDSFRVFSDEDKGSTKSKEGYNLSKLRKRSIGKGRVRMWAVCWWNRHRSLVGGFPNLLLIRYLLFPLTNCYKPNPFQSTNQQASLESLRAENNLFFKKVQIKKKEYFWMDGFAVVVPCKRKRLFAVPGGPLS